MKPIELEDIIKVIKMPFVLLFYILYMLFSIFIPSKYVSKVINIEAIESDLNTYFNDPFILKMIALIITILIFIYLK